jgi:biotin transport system substrate-specific component
MYVNDYYKRFIFYRRRLFEWQYELDLLQKVFLAIGFAALTGLAAQLRFFLPFTPVPITGQVFAVLVSAMFLGRIWGGASQAIYVGAGGAGLPWFAGFTSGTGILAGVTGGYLFGFIAAALVIGEIVNRFKFARSFYGLLPVLFIGIGIIYFFGALQLSIVLNLNLSLALELGVLPFIPLDLFKALVACWVGVAMLPKEVH